MAELVYSVGDITMDIRAKLEGSFSGVWIEGEVSNHREPGSGHHYFTLKDSFAQLSCVLFRGAASKSPVKPANGQQVKIFGNISVYEARGQYQLIAQTVQPKGFGDLQAKFEALKRKLDDEGLFAPERKKPLPVFPQRVGIVTSPTGAAIRDMLNVFGRRAPWLKILVYPARVQGEGAAEEIAAGVEYFNSLEGDLRPELVIVSRGGGSIEDLWAFNEEVVARSIAACEIPVMSGVGHEIDFTIADFVADRREPTPSAAAENAAPDGAGVKRHLGQLSANLDSLIENEIEFRKREVLSHQRELQAREPGRRIQGWIQSVDFLGERLDHVANAALDTVGRDFQGASRAFNAIHPERQCAVSADQLATLSQRLSELAVRAMEEKSRELQSLGSLMHSLSPKAVLERGFSITTDGDGKVVRDAKSLSKGDLITTTFSDGEASSEVQ
ncbi:exodeoxyribonuclease VII large subunit [Verrucomicrobiales bacterium]|jgi:exodeoxyribonuclease VII large subunit|nr:exodeoxyribonuclease VII large subunit [Verrucomicrobiales bacterium]MDB4358650.1 exodeoxyribonuclease VII large subunit [Verrucomicrobiales bacterium]